MKKYRSTFVPCAAGVFIAVLAGCTTIVPRPPKPVIVPVTIDAQTVSDLPTIDVTLLDRPAFDYRLGPGDVLDLEVIGEPNTLTTTFVGPDGKIYFYLLPGIDVWGLTLTQARQRIVQEMQKLIREEQSVSLTLRSSENQRVWLHGRFLRPGPYPMAGPMTLLEAVAEGGGPAPKPASETDPEPEADLTRAFVLRQGHLLPVDFQRLLRDADPTQNVYLMPGDVVYLPRASSDVFVLGAVSSPSRVAHGDQLTLLQAIAQAMPGREVRLSRVAILRGSFSQPSIATVDVMAILAGEAPDIALEPRDIVFVPRTAEDEPLNRYVELIRSTYARTLAVNATTKPKAAKERKGSRRTPGES
jgi:polysaccharide export outer membrane protein